MKSLYYLFTCMGGFGEPTFSTSTDVIMTRAESLVTESADKAPIQTWRTQKFLQLRPTSACEAHIEILC